MLREFASTASAAWPRRSASLWRVFGCSRCAMSSTVNWNSLTLKKDLPAVQAMAGHLGLEDDELMELLKDAEHSYRADRGQQLVEEALPGLQ